MNGKNSLPDNRLISIVIITYNRPGDLVELCACLARQQRPDLLREIIIINNASSVSYAPVEDFIRSHPDLPFVYLPLRENLGVARGRNHGAGVAGGELLFFIDDDTVLPDDQALIHIAESFYGKAENVAVVSYLVKYLSNGAIQKNVFPHKKFEAYCHKPAFATGYFVGCAHAIRRKAFIEAGGYPADFFYGMEEYDLSYRMIEKGYEIWYDAALVVLHKESPAGRQPRKEVLLYMWINKSKVAWRYLPMPYFITTVLAWSMHYLSKSGGDFRGWFKGWKAICSIPKKEQRQPVGTRAMTYLKSVQMRLFY